MAACGRSAPSSDSPEEKSPAAAAPSPSPAAAPAAVPEATRIGNAMELWRRSILDRNADGVMTCDQIFADAPKLFTPALIESAQNDKDERVRAFSTRVLGKFANPELGPVFLRSLEDRSPHVRGNAAWALGHLSPELGRGALERVLDKDSDAVVKKNATEALARLRPTSEKSPTRGR